MSHIVKAKVQMEHKQCLIRAAEHLGLQNLGEGRHKLYGRQHAEGIAFKLPDWNHPVVINTETGEVSYDNYGGSWGKQVELDKLVQRYSIERTKEEAEIAGGYTFEETVNPETGEVTVEMEEVLSV